MQTSSGASSCIVTHDVTRICEGCAELCCRAALPQIISGASYMVGTILLVAAEHIAMLYLGRVILGIGVGFAIQVPKTTRCSISHR